MPLAAYPFSATARPQRLLGVAISALALNICGVARAADPCRDAAPWSRLGTSGVELLRPLPLTLGGLAVVAPFALAPTGLDHELRRFAQRDLHGKPELEPVSVWTPYVLAGGLISAYAIGVVSDSCRAQRALSPIIQAGFLAYGSVALLKVGVGRRWPNGGDDPRAPDRLEHPERARDFAPFQHGIGAWPSGHTAVLFAGASAFRASNPELGFRAWLGYPLALGVASGMWLGDHHWASDIVSGALLGEAIGGSVGRSFSEALGVPGALLLTPLDANGFGAEWRGLW